MRKKAQRFLHEKRTWGRKFRDAFRGWRQSIRQQKSYRVHFFFAVAVVVVGAWLPLDLVRWCLILLCITAVLTAEMFNTALETLARAITHEYNRYIRRTLDIASGAVLTVSIGAAVIGAIIFLEALLRRFAS
jgi:diacylglycerol kinase